MTAFETFWAACPPGRKVDKPIVMAKFAEITSDKGMEATARDRDGNSYKLHLKATADELIEAMKAWRYRWIEDGTERCFIPHPATWLNKGRFMDFDEDERRELAQKFERNQEILAEYRARKVVPIR